MSAIVGGVEGLASAAPAASAGALLRAARQQRGLHIAALAVMLKVPQSKLDAIESDRLADLPDATFARALAKAMCQALKIDATPVLALLPKGNEPGLDRVNLGLNQPFREYSSRDDSRVSLADLKRPVVWAPMLLVAAAALVYFMPSDWSLSLPGGGPAASEPMLGAPVLAIPAAEPASEDALTAARGAAPPLASASAAAPVPVAPTTQVTQAATSLPGAAASQPAPVALPDGAPLRIHAIADTWIEVVDAQARLRMSRLVRKGEQVEFDVAPPLKLRVGNVGGTEVWLRGKAVDLASQARENVARLELD